MRASSHILSAHKVTSTDKISVEKSKNIANIFSQENKRLPFGFVCDDGKWKGIAT